MQYCVKMEASSGIDWERTSPWTKAMLSAEMVLSSLTLAGEVLFIAEARRRTEIVVDAGERAASDFSILVPSSPAPRTRILFGIVVV